MAKSIRSVVTQLGRLAALAGLSALTAPPSVGKEHRSPPQIRTTILVYTKAAGFVHKSIPAGTEAIRSLGASNGFGVDVTADPSAFTQANLAKYKAIVFLSTTGDILPAKSQRAALEGYIRHGGGFFGIHAASDMGPLASAWPFYLNLVGAAFKGHTNARLFADTPLPSRLGVTYVGSLASAPPDAEAVSPAMKVSSSEAATIIVEDRGSPATRKWGKTARRVDEWYGFASNPRGQVHVIASLDEKSYEPGAGAMGGDHPIAWCHPFEGGRSVYTGLGHPTTAWHDQQFLRHILGGIKMAMGTAEFRCG